jgi:hypothetical protein
MVLYLIYKTLRREIMKAIIFYRANGKPDSRIMEHDRDHDDLVRHIMSQHEGADIVGIMDYEAANEWVKAQLAN